VRSSATSYSSWLAAAGVPRERRDRYLGHVDLSMDARYTHQLDHQYLDDAKALGATCAGGTRLAGSRLARRLARTTRRGLR
jgi:hypothetical protein